MCWNRMIDHPQIFGPIHCPFETVLSLLYSASFMGITLR